MKPLRYWKITFSSGTMHLVAKDVKESYIVSLCLRDSVVESAGHRDTEILNFTYRFQQKQDVAT